MKLGIIGTAEVGFNLVMMLSELGHQVMLCSLTA